MDEDSEGVGGEKVSEAATPGPTDRKASAGCCPSPATPEEATIDAEECTGVSASWCPNCGDCTCPRDADGDFVTRTIEPATIWRLWPILEHVADKDCPLHGEKSKHA